MLSAARVQQYRLLKDDLEGAIEVYSTILSPYSNWPVSAQKRLQMNKEVSVYKKALEVCSAVSQFDMIGGDDTIADYFHSRIIDAAMAFIGEIIVQNLADYHLKAQCQIILEDFGRTIAPNKENSNVIINT